MTGLKLKVKLYTLIITIQQENWSYFAIATVAKTKDFRVGNLERFVCKDDQLTYIPLDCL